MVVIIPHGKDKIPSTASPDDGIVVISGDIEYKIDIDGNGGLFVESENAIHHIKKLEPDYGGE